MSKTGDHVASSCPIGLLIRNRRRELGLSQDDLAQQLGIAQGSISKLERGIGSKHHASRILAALLTKHIAGTG